MQTLYFQTVIVGSGFAGRTVASYLPEGSFMIVERGENRDFGEVLMRYDVAKTKRPDSMDAQKHAYQSDLPWNSFSGLSRWNYSRFAMIRGGSSNWWGGKATRFSPEIFSAQDALSWPFSYEEMVPWYAKAEQRLNISGDPANQSAPATITMPGVEYWRSAFAPYFKNAHLYNTAINKDRNNLTTQGYCQGRANCAVCREDAKARPDNIFSDHPMVFETMVMRIEFEGSRAVAIECFDGKQLFQIKFERLVLACNGIETPRLLARSDLPAGVRSDQIGAYLQDHAHVELSCKIAKPLIYGNAGGLTHVFVTEISGMYSTDVGDIEVSALALTHEPRAKTFKAGIDLDLLKKRGATAFLQDLSGCFDIFCELEIPPYAGLRVDLTSDEPKVLDDAYENLIPVFDGIVQEMARKLTRLGVTVLDINPIYRTGYGGHHFCGTTNCSNGPFSVVDINMQLIGTDNVYVSGSSVIPRAGGVAPTLTLVALAERLGSHLQITNASVDQWQPM
jgi:choline dehydrogenase-like flavoprotein